ncbi:hypothetical protein M0805_009469 [Coniferiporia weirii]|nr:hypothetical protein M0805_009469 [Coniferiporia weirii]
MSQSGNNSGTDQKFLHIEGNPEATFILGHALNNAFFVAIEVNFKGSNPRYPVLVRLKVGENIHKSPRFERGESISWVMGSYLYVPLSTDISIRVQEIHTFGRKQDIAIFSIVSADVVGKDTFSAEDAKGRSLVKLTCVSALPASAAERTNQSLELIILKIDALAKLVIKDAEAAVGNKKVLLESLGRASDVLSVLLNFTDFASSIHPAAGAAAKVVSLLYEQCKEQEDCHRAASDLMKELVSLLPFVGDIPRDLAKNDKTVETVKRMLELFCEISGFISSYSTKGMLEDVFSSRKDEIDSLKNEFQRLKEVYDWCIKVEVWRSVIETEKQTIDIQLQQLRPAGRAYYDIGRICLEGTRTAVLEQVRDWAASDERLFWLYGVAGSGKSSIANSVAHMFDERQRLLGCFFCKKDDPECRVPSNVFPTLALHFSKWHATYRSMVSHVIQGKDGPKLSQSLQWQFELLLKKPLNSLDGDAVDLPPKPLIVVIDALDEGGDSAASRSELAKLLLEMAGIVPWLKVFVTSRPLPEFEHVFRRNAKGLRTLDINVEVESAQVQKDILQYTKHCAGDFGLTEEQINVLALKASGLFIWISTVFRFIGTQKNKKWAINSVLSSTGNQEVGLDKLYTTVLKGSSMGYNDTQIIRSVLGIIACTSRNKPLPEDALVQFLCAMDQDIELEVLKDTIDSLQAVLYRDTSGNSAIRSSGKEAVVACNDLYRLISAYYTPISLSTPHLYISALSWAPTESFVANKLYPSFYNQPLVSSGKENYWKTTLWTVNADDTVYCAVFSPDGRYIACGLNDSTIRICDAQTGNAVGQPITGHSDSVVSVAYSPDGKHIVSGSEDETIRVWDAQTGDAIGKPLELHSDSVWAVAYSPDGKHIVSGSADKSLRIWDAQTRNAVGDPLIGHSETIYSIAYSPDGKYIVSGSEDETLRIWDAETGKAVGEPLAGHSDIVYCVAYSPDGRYIVSGSRDDTLMIWDAQTRDVVGEPLEGHSNTIVCVAYSPDGRHFVSGSDDKTMRIWDAQTRTTVGEPIIGHSDYVWSVAYSPDGRYIVSGSVDKTLRIWDAQTNNDAGEVLSVHPDSVWAVAYSPDGRCFVSGHSDNSVRIWDAQSGNAIGEPFVGHSDPIYSVAYSPDGKHIVSCSSDSTLRVWDVQTGDNVVLTGHSDSVRTAVYSLDGKSIVSGSDDHTLRVWDAQTGDDVGKPLTGHSDTVYSVAFSPDGKYIISGSDDDTIRIWDAQTWDAVGEPLAGHSDSVYAATYSPDGKYIVSCSKDKTLIIWDAQTRMAVGEPLKGHSDYVLFVTYSPDGRHILSSSSDKTLRIWDAQTGQPVGDPITGHLDSVQCVAYSPDGSHIVSASEDKTLRVWEMDCLQANFRKGELYWEGINGDGWVKDNSGRLLLWVPYIYRFGISHTSKFCIPEYPNGHPLKVKWEKLLDYSGLSWSKIFRGT